MKGRKGVIGVSYISSIQIKCITWQNFSIIKFYKYFRQYRIWIGIWIRLDSYQFRGAKNCLILCKLVLPSFGNSSSAVTARMFSCLAVYILYELRKKEYLFKENRLGQVKGMVKKRPPPRETQVYYRKV